jgi:uncharacterized membrane protein
VDLELLRRIPIFAAIPDEELAELAELLVHRSYAAGQPIIFLGDTGADLFLLQSGRAVVSYPNERGREVDIEELGPGSFFGEISLLDGGPRTANVRAVTPVDVLLLQRNDFMQFLLQRPAVAVDALTVLATRQRGMIEKLRGIRNVNEAELSERTRAQRIMSRVARVFASERFLLANIALIAIWILANLGLRALGMRAFDEPPTYFWLGFVISVEAIVITMFVLNSQRQQAERDRIHADLEYEVNVKAHMEVMELHRKLDRLLASQEHSEP